MQICRLLRKRWREWSYAAEYFQSFGRSKKNKRLYLDCLGSEFSFLHIFIFILIKCHLQGHWVQRRWCDLERWWGRWSRRWWSTTCRNGSGWTNWRICSQVSISVLSDFGIIWNLLMDKCYSNVTLANVSHLKQMNAANNFDEKIGSRRQVSIWVLTFQWLNVILKSFLDGSTKQ